MKKKYSKPLFLYEEFSLNTNIAGTCNVTGNFAVNQCGMPYDGEGFEGVNVFVNGVKECFFTEEDGEYNGVCYDVPFGANTLFSS